ncbi:MAG: hypothetical protein AAFZ15_06670 [Bacteroidota bacterium]
MDTFFTDFTSAESIYIMLVALGGFLIGFIVAWLLWRSKAKEFEAEAAKWKKSYDDLLLQYNEQKEELELKEADLVKAQREAKEAIEIAKSLEADKDRWQADLDAAIQDSVNARASVGSYQTTIEDLNNQIIGLKALNADLTAAAGSSNGDGNEEALQIQINELETEKNSLQSQLELAQLELEKAKSDLAFAGSPREVVNNGNDIFAAAPEKTDVDKGETTTLSAVAARDEVKAAIGTTIPVATEAEKDDLTRIKGIGSFLEKKLNGLGIYTFEQISQFDANMIEQVTAAIEFFPGRIERDDWVGQATALIGTVEEVKVPPGIKPDNLKIVEGIGPKIEKLLKDNGIADLLALSTAEEKRLREILFEAGSRYRIHDPTSWPGQAALAVAGKMDELTALQDRLKGGRDVG